MACRPLLLSSDFDCLGVGAPTPAAVSLHKPGNSESYPAVTAHSEVAGHGCMHGDTYDIGCVVIA